MVFDKAVGYLWVVALRRHAWRLWAVSGLTLGADQLTKYLIRTSWLPGESLPLLPPLLSLTYVQNTGAAFGLFKGQGYIFIGVSLLVIGWIVAELVARQTTPAMTGWGSALVLGGALGNLIDRLRFGYVIDFIDIHVWPVFNLGDTAITVGVGLLILQSVSGRETSSSTPHALLRKAKPWGGTHDDAPRG